MAKEKESKNNDKEIVDEFDNIDDDLPIVGNNGNNAVSAAELATFLRKEQDKDVPAIGSLYRVEEDFLSEVTVLNERQAAAYAIGDLQQEFANPKRKKSAWQILKIGSMRYAISVNGLGREQQVLLHRLKADLQATQSINGGVNIGQP